MKTAAATPLHRLSALCLVLAVVLSAQEKERPPLFQAGVNEILVDFVARDKKQRTVRDLKPEEITILENGVPQTVTSFRAYTRGGAAAPARVSGATTSQQQRQQNRIHLSRQFRLVALIFDRLGPDGRRFSRMAALDFLNRDFGDNVFYAVFSMDRGLRVIHPYTNDAATLRWAVEKATSGERSDFANDNVAANRLAAVNAGMQGASQALQAIMMSGTVPVGAVQVDGAVMSSEQASDVANSQLDLNGVNTREELGRVWMFSLWEIVKQLQSAPGRKTVLYFAEGLTMGNGLREQYKSMLAAANRSNVTVYAIDARGLLSANPQMESMALLADATQRSLNSQTSRYETSASVRAQMRTMDIGMDSIYANSQNMMADLAEATGGFLIANTNDYRPGLARLSEDFNAYYELTYTPKDTEYDGRFREIAVTVNRPGVTVQARDGYFALPPMEGQTVFLYEVPLLRALGANPLPKDLEFRSGLLRYRALDGLQQAVLVFDLPLKQITFTRDDAVSKYRTHISVLALVKDESGRVITKLSRDVPLNEPLDKLEGFQAGRFIVTKPLQLRPGRYLVESAAVDLEGNRLAAKRAVVVVTNHQEGPGVSDLVLLRRLDQPAEYPDPYDPLHLASGRVIPTLVDTIPADPQSQLSAFFTMYPDNSSAGKPQLVLDLLRDGQLISRAQPEVPEPNATGAIPYFANIPLTSVSPGQYQLRATLIQGEKAAQRSLFVNIE